MKGIIDIEKGKCPFADDKNVCRCNTYYNREKAFRCQGEYQAIIKELELLRQYYHSMSRFESHGSKVLSKLRELKKDGK